jgi:hypothetical protein
VFLVLRQVMPIASGLAGGSALSSYGVASRGLSWVWNAESTKKAREAAGTYAHLGVRGAVAGVGMVGSAAVQSSRFVYGQASAGVGTLARNWRNLRR